MVELWWVKVPVLDLADCAIEQTITDLVLPG